MGLKFVLEIDCGHDAFTCEGTESVAFATIEVARIMTEAVPKLERGGQTSLALYDVNGNRVGFAKFIGGVKRARRER